MSRHQDTGTSPWGWFCAVVPVKRETASLVTDEPSGSGMFDSRARATVCTRPVGLLVHV